MSLIDTIKSLCCKFCKKPKPTTEDKAKEKPKAAAKKEAQSTTTEVKDAKLQVPEDPALKRHFIAALKAEIESDMQPRPSEATLKRHYDSTVQAKLENLLG